MVPRKGIEQRIAAASETMRASAQGWTPARRRRRRDPKALLISLTELITRFPDEFGGMSRQTVKRQLRNLDGTARVIGYPALVHKTSSRAHIRVDLRVYEKVREHLDEDEAVRVSLRDKVEELTEELSAARSRILRLEAAMKEIQGIPELLRRVTGLTKTLSIRSPVKRPT